MDNTEPLIQNPIQPDPPQPEGLLWNTPLNCRHSARVIMDEEGLTGVVDKVTGLKAKDLLCACIQQESQFNPKAIGKPNFDGSRDYGLVQMNSKYWIGPGKYFASIDEVLNNPEKSVRFMCEKYKSDHLDLWVSYTSGAYKKWL